MPRCCAALLSAFVFALLFALTPVVALAAVADEPPPASQLTDEDASAGDETPSSGDPESPVDSAPATGAPSQPASNEPSAAPRKLSPFAAALGAKPSAETTDATPKPDAQPPADAPTTPGEEPSDNVAENAAENAERRPGHSAHGEVFNDGPRQQARLIEGTGRVHLAVTSDVPGVQAYFDQGIGQLHGFWYFEAERSFRQCAALDPDCAMAYWGMAMANINNESRAKVFIKKATERRQHASPREAMWIDAWSAFYEAGGKDDKQRRRQLVRALEAIVHEHPDELEAKAFLAVQIWHNSRAGLPINSHQAVDALLSEVFAAEPLHPAHHYRIHLWDKEKPARALASEAAGGRSAPAIAHMWHMPGHTYWELKRYAEAAWQQEASARVDHAHMMREQLLPDQIHNYAHNNEWLIRSLSHVGRAREAVAMARNMIELPRHPKYNTPTKSASAQFGRTRLYEVLARYELWDDVVALADTPYLESTDAAAEKIRRLRLLGAAHFGRGDAEAGQAQIAALEALLADEKTAQQKSVDEAAEKARGENKPDAEVDKARTAAEGRHTGEIKRIETGLADLRGRAAMAAGQFETARAEFDKAGDLPKELLAQVALAAGDAARAEQLAREAVDAAPGQLPPLANYVDVLYRAGKTAEAKAEFEKLRAASAGIDMDVPMIARLAPLARELDLPDDWRVPATTAPDFGERPPLDTLGPRHWHPWNAAGFTLTDAQGRAVSLADYRGKPVVLVFYLGFGCLHCVQQLQALVPMAGEFDEAGISILAISNETVDELKAALAARDEASPFPFPLAADPQLSTFREYRAFDDFEELPLHATVLIDGAGRVRWQDIGPEPFMELKFLLDESKRLLALPAE